MGETLWDVTPELHPQTQFVRGTVIPHCGFPTITTDSLLTDTLRTAERGCEDFLEGQRQNGLTIFGSEVK